MKSDDRRHGKESGTSRETPDVSHIGNPDVAHETNDVNARAIVKFVGAMAIATFAIFGLMYGLLRAFEHIETRKDAEVSNLARKDSERLPPYPRLQAAKGDVFQPSDMTSDPMLQRQMSEGKAEGEFGMTKEDFNFELKEPMAEWHVLREIKLRELQSYGMTGRKPDEYRIPVDHAKELLLQRGALVSRPQPQAGQGGAQNEIQQVNSMEGYDVTPTAQSSGQRAERRVQ